MGDEQENSLALECFSSQESKGQGIPQLTIACASNTGQYMVFKGGWEDTVHEVYKRLMACQGSSIKEFIFLYPS